MNIKYKHESRRELISELIFILWDGMTFFDHDDNKLERLEGKSPRWYDRFFN